MDQRQRMQVGWWGLAVCALVAIVAAPAVFGGGSSDGPDGADDRTDVEGADALESEAGPVLAPHDGLDSLGFPVSASPASGLVHDQVVTVSGEGFPANRALGVVMCSGAVELGGGAAQCMLSPYTPVSSDQAGAFEVELTVRRILYLGGEEIDCAAPPPEGAEFTCAIAVGAIDDYDQSGTVGITFDDSVPPPPRPSFEVSPTEGLVDGDVVTVTASDVSGDLWWHTMVCTRLDEAPADWHLDDGVLCDYTYDPVAAGEDGHRQEIVVTRWFGHTMGLDPIDCGEDPGRCWIQIEAGMHRPEPVPLSFDTSVPAPPKPEVVTHDEWEAHDTLEFHHGPTVIDPDGSTTDTIDSGRPLPPPEPTVPGPEPSTTVVSGASGP